VLLVEKGDLQERHRALDSDLLEACVAGDPERAAAAFRDHLELATGIFSVELAGRSIFAF
jgi:DNA-binding FadR family transcriptional regulator